MSNFEYRSTMLSLCSANLVEMGAFYEALLGAPEEVCPGQWLRFKLVGGSLVLWFKVAHVVPSNASLQLCLVVDDLDDARERLGDRVLSPLRVASHGRECDLADPDGNLIILYQPEKT